MPPPVADLVRAFTDALGRLHADRDVEPLVALFAEDATLAKLDRPHEEHGPAGARQFWLAYRDVFDDVAVTFGHTVEGEDSAALEWTSNGTLRDGTPLSYRGVSVLEVGTEQLNAFRTYYDAAAFRTEPPTAEAHEL